MKEQFVAIPVFRTRIALVIPSFVRDRKRFVVDGAAPEEDDRFPSGDLKWDGHRYELISKIRETLFTRVSRRRVAPTDRVGKRDLVLRDLIRSEIIDL